MLLLQLDLLALLVHDVARVAVQQEPFVVDVIGVYIKSTVLSLSTMSVSFLLRALNSSWYFRMMQELDTIGLTFMSRFMLLIVFFTIDISVSRLVSKFWK